VKETVPTDRSEELKKAYENMQILKLEISRLQNFEKPEKSPDICDSTIIETVPPEKIGIARSTKKRGVDRRKDKKKIELIGKNRELWSNMESMREMFKKKKLLSGTAPKEYKVRNQEKILKKKIPESEPQQSKVSWKENLKLEKVSASESAPTVMENYLFDLKKNHWNRPSTLIEPKLKNCPTNPALQKHEKIQIFEKSSANRISSIFTLGK
jgi:hypothetical protein